MAANGITPEEMMRVVDQQVPTPFRDVDVGTLLRPNLAQLARTGVHPTLGEMALPLWIEFFLLHEAHHLYVVMKRARGGE